MADPTDARLVAGSDLGGIDAMLQVWAAAEPQQPFVELNRRLNERLRSIWPA